MKTLDKLGVVALKVPMPESSDNSINTSICAQKIDTPEGIPAPQPPSIPQSPQTRLSGTIWLKA